MNNTIGPGTTQPQTDSAEGTVIFGVMPDSAAAITFSIIERIGRYLHWRNRTIKIIKEVLRLQGGESISIDCPHAKMGAELWPLQSESSQQKSAQGALKIAREDMERSGFHAFQAKTDNAWKFAKLGKGSERKKNLKKLGPEHYTPTKYLPGDFFPFFAKVRLLAAECDLFSLRVNARNARLDSIIARACGELGYQPIERDAKKVKGRGGKASPAEGGAEDQSPALTDLGERTTWKDIESWFAQVGEQGFEFALGVVGGGKDLKVFEDKWAKVGREISARVQAAVRRAGGEKVSSAEPQPAADDYDWPDEVPEPAAEKPYQQTGKFSDGSPGCPF